jgi:hypothetical protein
MVSYNRNTLIIIAFSGAFVAFFVAFLMFYFVFGKEPVMQVDSIEVVGTIPRDEVPSSFE